MVDFKGLEAFDDVQRLIVVAAHPDDLETICGGTIALLAQRGVTVFSVNCTLGDIGTQDAATTRPAVATARLTEAEDAARLLGIQQVFSLGHHDGELVADLELRAQVARLYRITQADTLITFDPFWTGQVHPDHRAAGQAALDAYMPSKMPLYRPEQLREPGAGLGVLKRVFLFSTSRARRVCGRQCCLRDQAGGLHGASQPVPQRAGKPGMATTLGRRARHGARRQPG